MTSAHSCPRRGHERNPTPLDLKAVRTGIGAALRTLYFEALREEVADRIAEC
jgi:hypothetical protein